MSPRRRQKKPAQDLLPGDAFVRSATGTTVVKHGVEFNPERDILASFAAKVHPDKVKFAFSQAAQRMGKGFMQCHNCTRIQDLTPELAEQYLQNGWPVCCPSTLHGGTMQYHRAEERKRG